MVSMFKSENFKLHIGIVLIFLCSLLHHFDLMSVFRLHSLFLTKSFTVQYSAQVTEHWVWVTVVGRILGALCIYKIVTKFGFFKAILFTCIGHALVSFVFVALEVVQSTSFNSYYNLLVAIRFLYAFFTPSAFMVPAMYCFKIIHSKHHYLFSVCAALIWPLTGIISRYFLDCSYHLSLQSSSLVFFVSAALGLVFCLCAIFCLKDLRAQNFFQVPTKKSNYVLCVFFFLLGAICSVGIFYPSYIFHHYITDVLILSLPKGISPSYLHWILLLFFLPISGVVTSRVGFVKSLHISFLGLIASAVILWITPCVTASIYLGFQVSFVMFFSLFLAQVYFMAYRVARKTQSIYYPVIWVVLGYSFATVLEIYVNKLRLPINLPTISTLLLAFMILICLIVINKYNFFTRREKLKQ